MTRKEALKLGLPRYTAGKPCVVGHGTERYSADGTCVVCRRFRIINKVSRLAISARYRASHREERREEYRSWYQNNKTKLAQYRLERCKTNLNYRLARQLRIRIWGAVTSGQKAGSAVRDLGCDISFFKLYIAKKFTKGMSWRNWGQWHLDHIKPLSSFDLSDRRQFLLAVHYTNYQPLWKRDNLSKGSKS